MADFVDRVKVNVIAGSGGHGIASVHREKFKPLGGPDGGNGGRGGSVIFRASDQETTLLTYHHRPHHKAANGTQGAGSLRHGKNSDDLVLPVPIGTVIKDLNGELIADLSAEGDELVVAEGGRGGLGNAALANRARRAPGFALLGEPGEETDVVLELKSIADVALVGFPSAGKSSLIAAMSAARPKIADYPFTTLAPNLGVVDAAGQRYTIADVPGLIPGASEGKGLGLDFLRHIERCSVIAHVIDTSSFEIERDPVSDLDTIEAELSAYQGDLGQVEGYVPMAERPRVIILNKIDVPDGRELADMVKADLEKRGLPVYEVSAVSHEGLRELSFGLARIVEENRVKEAELEEARVVIRPRAVGSSQAITVTKIQHGGERVYQVRGRKPELWVKQTNFGNDEAVGYLADRLASAGVEDQLLKAGALPGDPVVIGPVEGGVIFDWEPTVSTGAELLAGRGEDPRLYERTRSTARERRAAFLEKMDAKEAARQELRDERAAGIWTDPGSGE
ncbi:GTPase ObgE [Actinomyces minihominis]|uniref:GTPase ObgE n=1 Tax=Actinomyces minihominis TaxID=2002838 RepID=UPI000C082056|nr:GTPase ObgE [Actinomyces minihominis]